MVGLYDTPTKMGHMQLVDNHQAETFIPIIQKFVKPGTTIYLYQWPAYTQLKNLGYHHMTVNHSENFVDPNRGTCTNTIEAYWTTLNIIFVSTGSIGDGSI